MNAVDKVRQFARSITTNQLIESVAFFEGRTDDDSNRVVFSVLAAEGCRRAGLSARAVAQTGNVTRELIAALGAELHDDEPS